jgi:hypothetical protein
MAWTEKIGPHSWRVRYPTADGGIGSHAAKTSVSAWARLRAGALDVEIRTEENYCSRIRTHIEPRWRSTALGDITALAVTLWIKQLRRRYAKSTVAGIVTVFSMMLDDAVDERLIAVNPVRRRARRGRRRELSPVPVERVWASPEQVVRIADNAESLSNHCYGLLVVTAGWTGARWGELTGCVASTPTSTMAASSSTPTPGACTKAPTSCGWAAEDSRFGANHHPAAVPDRAAARPPRRP